MNTTTLEYIIAIAEEQSITKAADKFFLSQPALSQHLKKIETEVGAPLFTRNKSNWQLTDVGKIYVSGARNILHLYNNSLAKIEEFKILNNEKVSIIVGNGLQTFVKKKILPSFSELYPDTKIDLMVGNNVQIEDCMTNGIPYLSIFFANNNKLNMIMETEVFEDEIRLCVHKNSKLNEKLADGFDATLLKDEFFILSKAGTTHRDIQELFFSESKMFPRVVGESSNFSSAIHMLSNGYGCTFLPKALCQKESSVFNHYKTDKTYKYTINYGYSKEQELLPTYKKLIEIIEREFKNNFLNYSANWITELENVILSEK